VPTMTPNVTTPTPTLATIAMTVAWNLGRLVANQNRLARASKPGSTGREAMAAKGTRSVEHRRGAADR
jgi:hypothetical protein